MATSRFVTEAGAIDVSVESSGDLSAGQYFAVKLDSNGRAVLCGANDKALGILQNAPTALGETAQVRIAGVSLLKVSEAVVLGNYLTPTSAGKGEVADAAGENYFARALGTYTTDDLADVQLAWGEVEASDA